MPCMTEPCTHECRLIWQAQLACVIILCSCRYWQETPQQELGRTKTGKVWEKVFREKKSSPSCWACIKILVEQSWRPFVHGFLLNSRPRKNLNLTLNTHSSILCCHATVIKDALNHNSLACTERPGNAALNNMTDCGWSWAEHKYQRMSSKW